MCRCFASCSSGLRVQRSTKVSLLFCEAELELPCYPHEKVHRSVNSHNRSVNNRFSDIQLFYSFFQTHQYSPSTQKSLKLFSRWPEPRRWLHHRCVKTTALFWSATFWSNPVLSRFSWSSFLSEDLQERRRKKSLLYIRFVGLLRQDWRPLTAEGCGLAWNCVLHCFFTCIIL